MRPSVLRFSVLPAIKYTCSNPASFVHSALLFLRYKGVLPRHSLLAWHLLFFVLVRYSWLLSLFTFADAPLFLSFPFMKKKTVFVAHSNCPRYSRFIYEAPETAETATAVSELTFSDCPPRAQLYARSTRPKQLRRMNNLRNQRVCTASRRHCPRATRRNNCISGYLTSEESRRAPVGVIATCPFPKYRFPTFSFN